MHVDSNPESSLPDHVYCKRIQTCTSCGQILSPRAYKKPSWYYESQHSHDPCMSKFLGTPLVKHAYCIRLHQEALLAQARLICSRSCLPAKSLNVEQLRHVMIAGSLHQQWRNHHKDTRDLMYAAARECPLLLSSAQADLARRAQSRMYMRPRRVCDCPA